jgi:alpha-tubulin suppressor-like RCC1 family protein
VDAQVYFPTPAAGGLRFSQLSTGSLHACGIGLDQVAYCWGGNFAGSLGTADAPNTFRPSPTPVLGGLQFAEVSAGYLHTCGLTVAGAAYCWGLNAIGELGTGDQDRRNVPAAVVGDLQFATLSTRPGSTFQVEQDSCGLTPDGAAWCWGGNQGGALGTGSPMTESFVPVPVAGGHTFTYLQSSGGYSCGLAPPADLYCWGRGAAVPTLVAGGFQWATVSLGGEHACGITTSGQLYCWGGNEFGQLGVGRGVSGPVADPSPPFGVDGVTWREVAAGIAHTCAIDTEGAAWCWGLGEEGALGIGELPVHVGLYMIASPARIVTTRPVD